jgi:hypothetical protein
MVIRIDPGEVWRVPRTMGLGAAWGGDHGRKTRSSVGKQRALIKPSLTFERRRSGAILFLEGRLAPQPEEQSDPPPARVL